MMRDFSDALVEFIFKANIKGIIKLTSSFSPVKRDRESNRDIPEIYAYINNYLYKKSQDDWKQDYYEKHKIRKFGYWLADCKRKTH